jgi:hypothetical protein
MNIHMNEFYGVHIYDKNNMGWTESTWIFMGVIPLILLYLIKVFLKTKLWDKKLLARIHYNNVNHMV